KPPGTETTLSFEWGETVYIMVYNFPDKPDDVNHVPPQVNIRLSVNGRVLRQLSVSADQFASPTSSPNVVDDKGVDVHDTVDNSTITADGYGVLAFTFQGGGANSLPPGPGTISADISTGALSGPNAVSQEIMSDPATSSTAFKMANPLAMDVTSLGTTTNGVRYAFADTVNPYDHQVVTNGTPDVDGQPTSRMMKSLGFIQDNIAGSQSINVYDRSLMCLIRGTGSSDGGLDQVRVERSDMSWQGGSSSIYNALDALQYPGFEEPPLNYPNDSSDYPNIEKSALQFVFNPNGNAANPGLTATSLLPPLDSSGNVFGTGPNSQDDIDHPEKRIPQPTPLQITLQAPKHQPANNYLAMLSAPGGFDDTDSFLYRKRNVGGDDTEPQGYWALVKVFVDPTNTGQWSDQTAYRQFHLAGDIVPHYAFGVTTPNVDLGSVASGTLYDPLNPLGQDPVTGAASPWQGGWRSFYKDFGVENDSNVNLLNLRVALASNVDTGQVLPWSASAGANDVQAWLDESVSIASNVTSKFAPPNPNKTTAPQNNVFSQKPRVADNAPSYLTLNPSPRPNANLGVGPGAPPINPNFPGSVSPMVGLSVPLGFPIGQYSSLLRVIDDTPISGGGNSRNEVWEVLNGNNSLEPYSDPGLTLSFNIRETRLTNTNTPFTATMADQTPSGQLSFSNTSPAAMRDVNGTLAVAWSSNRTDAAGNPTYQPAAGPSQFATSQAQRLYVATVGNTSTFNSGGVTSPGTDPFTGNPYSSPLRDLFTFAPDAGNQRWFTPQTPTGYPFTSLFNDSNGTVVTGTEKYDAPAFPLSGSIDPLTESPLGFAYMAFRGGAEETSGAARVRESEIFLTPVKFGSGGQLTLDSSGGPWSTSNPALSPLAEDPLTEKGKPSVLQTAGGAFLFYSVTSGGQTSIHYDRFTGSGFGPWVDLGVGSGFESASDPSVTARAYLGVDAALRNANASLVDLTFSGKLRGRSNSDVYLGQMRMVNNRLVDANLNDIETRTAGSPFVDLSQQVNERLISDGKGTFRARGVEWDRTQPIQLIQYVNGQPVDLLVDQAGANTKSVDRESGLISYDTTLGGKVYFDTELGAVRFSQGAPNPNVDVRLTYTPVFLRLTPGGDAAYSSPTGIFDSHYLSDYTEWYDTSDKPLAASTGVRDTRFAFFFGRAAAGQTQTAQPYYTTMRLGLRLPTAIATGPGGVPASFKVTGNAGPYQIDAANGRVYFTAVDEDRLVQVTYTGLNETDKSLLPGLVVAGTVSFVLEQNESPVVIDQAVNESNLSAFLDPFTFPSSNTVRNERPPLFWLFYTSTRAGGPDVYFQTIAPRLAPVVK
ncbi:MAG TPA: hypothetical protein VG944_12585, partial [Fimbriimonas sp.]|nr:hypothetical protein [Fimbriimonas sp.]